MDKKINLIKTIPILLTFSYLIFILITYEIDFEKVSFNSYQSFFAAALIGLLIVFIQNYLIAKRWLLITNFFGEKNSLLRLFYAISYSSFLNQFLPLPLAGDAYRSYFQKTSGSSLYKGISSVLIDRVIGLISLVIMSSLFILFLPINRIYHYISIFVLTSFIYLFFKRKKINIIFLPQKINTFLDIIFSRRVPLKSYIFSFFSHFLSVILFVFICLINKVDTIEIIKLGLLFPISLTLSTLPFSLGGWGVREGSLLFLSALVNLENENILFYSLQFGLILALTGLVNSIFILPISKFSKK